MAKLRILASLTTLDNDFQIEQAALAHRTASRLDVDLQLAYAENDPITQSQQLLKAIQSPKAIRPEAIVVEPASGAGLLRVAKAAAEVGIGWVVVNSDAEYLDQLRESAPAFAVTSDHKEIGRIQGRQVAVLLPTGGRVLYIQGPSYSAVAQQRAQGFLETKPANVDMKVVRAKWTHESSHSAVSGWLRLSSMKSTGIDAVVAQDDAMAFGAREAFRDLADCERWLGLPLLGCDGLPRIGQAWVRRGYLTATVIIPPNFGLAIQLLVGQIRGQVAAPLRTLTYSMSFPALPDLASLRGQGTKAVHDEQACPEDTLDA